MSTKLNLQVLAGDYVKTALIAEWKVKEGDTVKKGDILLVCETAKVSVDIESPCDGVILQILYGEDSDVDISETIAVIGNASERPAPHTELEKTELNAEEAAKLPAEQENKVKKPTRVLMTPVARKTAGKLGIDIPMFLEDMAAQGIKKAVKKDVLKYQPAQQTKSMEMSQEADVSEIKMRGMRKTIADKMGQSKREKPHVTHMMDVQVDSLFEIKEVIQKKYPEEKFSLTGLIAIAVKKALLDFPEFNATAKEGMIYRHSKINIGIAVDIPEGLVVPVIRNCEQKTGRQICAAVKSLAGAAKSQSLTPVDYTGGTFTITNVGTSDVKYFTPIINYPEVAILGVCNVRKELAMTEQGVAEKRVMGLCLSFDHGAVDGAPAARFLRTIKEYLEHMYLAAF